jgi:hypothetical protein
VRGLEGAETDALLARADLRVEHPIGSRSDAAVAGAGAAARRHLVGGGGRWQHEASGRGSGARRVMAARVEWQSERRARGREVSVAVGERGARR